MSVPRVMPRITPRTVLLVVLGAAILAALAVITAHTALAAGSGPGSTTPPGSGPSAPSLAPLNAKSDETKPIVGLLWLVGVESLVIFVAVCAALVIVFIRFSHHPGQDEEPKQVFGNRRIEIGWTLLPALILLVGFIATVVVMVDINDPPAAEAANAQQVD